MEAIEREIELIRTQVEDWNAQISLLAVKHKTASEVALQFAQELVALRNKHREALQNLRDLEAHRNGNYMWENIGDGG